MEEKLKKQCKKCGRSMPIDHFGKCPQHKDGRHSWCKECKMVADFERRHGIAMSKYYRQKMKKAVQIETLWRKQDDKENWKSDHKTRHYDHY